MGVKPALTGRVTVSDAGSNPATSTYQKRSFKMIESNVTNIWACRKIGSDYSDFINQLDKIDHLIDFIERFQESGLCTVCSMPIEIRFEIQYRSKIYLFEMCSIEVFVLSAHTTHTPSLSRSHQQKLKKNSLPITKRRTRNGGRTRIHIRRDVTLKSSHKWNLNY